MIFERFSIGGGVVLLILLTVAVLSVSFLVRTIARTLVYLKRETDASLSESADSLAHVLRAMQPRARGWRSRKGSEAPSSNEPNLEQPLAKQARPTPLSTGSEFVHPSSGPPDPD